MIEYECAPSVVTALVSFHIVNTLEVIVRNFNSSVLQMLLADHLELYNQLLTQLEVLLLLLLMTCLFRPKIEIVCRRIRSSSTLRELHCGSFSLDSFAIFSGCSVNTDNQAVSLTVIDSCSMKQCSLQFCGWFISYPQRKQKTIEAEWIPRSLNEYADYLRKIDA